jgi:hypothetical protein
MTTALIRQDAALIQIDAARHALAKASTIADVKAIKDTAEIYARRQQLGQEPDALVASVKELTAIDRDIPIYGIRPMREYVSQRLEQPIPKVYVWQIHKG